MPEFWAARATTQQQKMMTPRIDRFLRFTRLSGWRFGWLVVPFAVVAVETAIRRLARQPSEP
ncbi:MAG: hypothetical protein WB562_08930 [Candidatus Sulfotelmatobacter sp.]